jgi:hypothetical protein
MIRHYSDYIKENVHICIQKRELKGNYYLYATYEQKRTLRAYL